MKKLISMLAVLIMIFSLFAAIPAYAADLGKFNIPEDSTDALYHCQEIYFKFHEPVTSETRRANIIKYLQGTSSESAHRTAYVADASHLQTDTALKKVFDNESPKNFASIGNGGTKYYATAEFEADNQTIRIKRYINSSGKSSDSWVNKNTYGRVWYLPVTDGNSNAKQAEHQVIVFHVQSEKKLANTGTTLSLPAEGGTEIPGVNQGKAVTDKFNFTFKYPYFESRGEDYRVTVKKNGKAYTAFKEEYKTVKDTSSDSTTEDPNNYVITVSPETEWDPGATYDVNIVFTAVNYAKDGTKGTAEAFNETWKFTTEGDPLPEEPGETTADYTAAFENGAATITNNTDAALTDAMLVLTAKNGAKLTKVKSVIPFSLAAGATSEAIQCFELANGETFDFFIWNRATLQPILNK